MTMCFDVITLIFMTIWLMGVVRSVQNVQLEFNIAVVRLHMSLNRAAEELKSPFSLVCLIVASIIHFVFDQICIKRKQTLTSCSLLPFAFK